ncbi:MAG: hypothetical protein MUE75_13380 [Algoriphagus sp.]|nr:hypothetical protein [Algoriphagus sp.]
MSFNYGPAHDFFACCAEKPPANLLITNFTDKSNVGEVFGFEFGYRPKDKKNEWGFGFAKQVNTKDYTATIETSLASVEIEEFRLKNTKNFHYLFLKRHFINEKLIGTFGIYNLRYRDQSIEVIANSDKTQMFLRESSIEIDFGVFLGVEYYVPVRNFQVGVRSRLYYTQGYSESFESFEISPVIRFRL